MEYLRQTINSGELSGIFNLPQTLRDKKVEVIILPAEDNLPEKPNHALKLGFLKDKVPPLPDSFFDPLPERSCKHGDCKIFARYAHISLGGA